MIALFLDTEHLQMLEDAAVWLEGVREIDAPEHCDWMWCRLWLFAVRYRIAMLQRDSASASRWAGAFASMRILVETERRMLP